MDPLVLMAHSDIPPSLDSPVLGTAATVLQQSNFSMDDVQTVSAGALGCLVALPVKNLSQDPQTLTCSSNLAVNTTKLTSSSIPQGNTSVPELLAPIKVEPDSPPGPDAIRQQEGSKGVSRPVFSSPPEKHSPQKDTGLSAGTSNFYLVWSAIFSHHCIAHLSYTQFWGCCGLIIYMQTFFLLVCERMEPWTTSLEVWIPIIESGTH